MMAQSYVSNGVIRSVFPVVWMDKYMLGLFQGYVLFAYYQDFIFSQLETELYDPFSESILGRRFIGHSDAVWSLSVQNENLLSCSSDGTVKIWNIETAEVKFNYSNEVNGKPSDAKFTKESKKIIIRIVFILFFKGRALT